MELIAVVGLRPIDIKDYETADAKGNPWAIRITELMVEQRAEVKVPHDSRVLQLIEQGVLAYAEPPRGFKEKLIWVVGKKPLDMADYETADDKGNPWRITITDNMVSNHTPLRVPNDNMIRSLIELGALDQINPEENVIAQAVIEAAVSPVVPEVTPKASAPKTEFEQRCDSFLKKVKEVKEGDDKGKGRKKVKGKKQSVKRKA